MNWRKNMAMRKAPTDRKHRVALARKASKLKLSGGSSKLVKGASTIKSAKKSTTKKK